MTYRTRSNAIEAEQDALDTLARMSEAISLIAGLRNAVKPFSRTATGVLNEVLAILERERTAAIERRVAASKQI